MQMLLQTLTPRNPLTSPSTPRVTLSPRQKKPLTPGLIRHLPFGFRVPNIRNNVNNRVWTSILIGVSPIAHFGRVTPVPHAMTPIGQFGARLVVAIKVVVAVSVVVAIGLVAIRTVRETKGEKERRTGADVGRTTQRSLPQKKKPSGTPLTLQWLSFLRES